MKSIGLFWKAKVQEPDNNCPHKDECEVIKKDKKGNKSEEFEVHINLWNTETHDIGSHKRQHLYALDFGIVCPLQLKELVLLLPVKVEKGKFVDLVSRLAKDRELMCTVFNDNLTIESKPTKSYHLVRNDSSTIKYLLYELSQENIVDVAYSQDNGYTVIKIENNIDDGPSDSVENLYVRFRIILNDMSTFAIQRKVSNDWFQSAFSSSYMFDFRLNDVRELDKKVTEKLVHEQYAMSKLNKVHFFYMADADEIIENGSSMKLDSRLLETHRWHSYFGDKIELQRENLAHHWKKCLSKTKEKDENGTESEEEIRTPFDDFSLFFKVVYSHYKFNRVMLYSLIVLVLGFLASSLVSLLQSIGEMCATYAWVFWLSIIIIVSLAFVICLKYHCRMN